MRLSSHQWDVTGSDVGPSKPSPDNTPLHNPPALALLSQLLEDKPWNLGSHMGEGRATRSKASVILVTAWKKSPLQLKLPLFHTLHASIMREPFHIFGCVCYNSWWLKHLEVQGCLQNYGVLIDYCKIMDLTTVCQIRHELVKKHTNNLKLRRLASTLGKPSYTSKA